MHRNASWSPTRLAALVLALCFLFNFVARGIGDTFMVFLLPLEAQFGWHRSQTAGVYSTLMVVSGLSSPLAGVLVERWGPRLLYSAGLVVLAAGYFAAAFATEVWHFYLCIGVLGGLGAGAIGMVPATALLGRWFSGRLSTATGLVYAGFGCGSLVMVPLAQAWIQSSGWRSAYQALALVLLVLLVASQLVPWRTIVAGPDGDAAPSHRSRASRDARGPLRAALRERRFWLLVQVMFFTAVGMYLVLVQSVAYLVDLGVPPLQAATAYGGAAVLSVVGVSCSGWFADRFSHRATATATFIGTGTGVGVLYALSYGYHPLLLACYVLLFGIFQGARGPIVASLTARLYAGPGQAAIYGVIYACMAIGAGLGAVFSGLLHDLTGGYQASFLLALACLALAASPFWTSGLLIPAQGTMRRPQATPPARPAK
jgi:MFS family permease